MVERRERGRGRCEALSLLCSPPLLISCRLLSAFSYAEAQRKHVRAEVRERERDEKNECCDTHTQHTVFFFAFLESRDICFFAFAESTAVS